MRFVLLWWTKSRLHTHGGFNLHAILFSCCSLPTNRFKYTLAHRRESWQEVKEDLAHRISGYGFSFKRLEQLHARAIFLGLRNNLYICSLLLSKYCGFHNLETAERIFDDCLLIPTKTLLWNSMMRGYYRNQQPRSAIELYFRMVESPCGCMPDHQTFNLVITACTDLSEFELGYKIHSHARNLGLELDVLVGTSLIVMYGKAGDLERGRLLFKSMPKRDFVSWNAMIAGYAQQGSLPEVLDLFQTMKLAEGIQPTQATMVSLACACGATSSLRAGETIHVNAVKNGLVTNLFVGNSLMEMYTKCNHLNSALLLFGEMKSKDAISWSIIIGGFVWSNLPSIALKFFNKMIFTTIVSPTRPILLNILLACADLGDWQRSMIVEEYYIKCSSSQFQSDACLNTILIYVYTRCGKIDMSLKLLERIPSIRKDVIAWNVMIKACSELGQVDRASIVLLEMRRRGINPDPVTFLTLFALFSSTALLRKGMESHTDVIKRGFESEKSIAHSLIDMYAKCGSIKDSNGLFQAIPEKDVVSWSLIIKGYAWNGNGHEVLKLFNQMKETGVRPNQMTFVSILTAYSHSGFVEEARKVFKSMKEEYNLDPCVEHYACMVDLFCRAGLLLEAHLLIKEAEVNAFSTARLWGTLLSACRTEGNLVVGETAAKHLFFLEPRNPANYMMLANIYISAGSIKDGNDVLGLLGERGLIKNPGYSWLEGRLVSFTSPWSWSEMVSEQG